MSASQSTLQRHTTPHHRATHRHHSTQGQLHSPGQLWPAAGSKHLQHTPAHCVQAHGIEEGRCHEPCVAVHGNERKPVTPLHAITGKVDAERRLWQLRRYLFSRQLNRPCTTTLACAVTE